MRVFFLSLYFSDLSLWYVKYARFTLYHSSEIRNLVYVYEMFQRNASQFVMMQGQGIKVEFSVNKISGWMGLFR